MILSLTGFMGSGKSTVGRLVADALGCPFLDLDALIEKKAGRSIPEIFAEEGEAGFRALEARLLADTVKRYASATAVLSLGGGALGNPASERLIRGKTLCIYLQASPKRSGSAWRAPGPPGPFSPATGKPFWSAASPPTKKPPMSSWTRTVSPRNKLPTKSSSTACSGRYRRGCSCEK